ncbi:MAG: DEAD/DEAH box helicase [Methanobacteriota archaeon]|nr:MAG: DEAD/DEAH box helicase [Euryarchaeota archaeon]
MRVAGLGLDARIVEILKGQGIEELYPPQTDAIGPALLGENLVLAIPTASGKSLVAYLAILASVLRGGKALYIVPLRALAAEKYEDLKEFEQLGMKVGVSVGDYDSVDPTLEKFDVIVATSERADSLLRHRTNWLQQLTVVVADEVHLINDADRGPTLEITLAKLRQVNPKAQVLALSATIKNSDQLAKWLEAEHVKSEWRPVPLKEGVYHDGLIHFVDKSITEIKAGEDAISGLVADIMSTGGQALVFVNTRRSTEALAKVVGSRIRHDLDEKKKDHLKKVAESLSAAQDEPTSMGARLARCIENGAAFHNAGLTNPQRAIVEKEFRKGRLACIVATPTLAAGINLPARRVIVRDLNRFDVNFGLAPIPVLEVKQMCGRAGRPRYDKYGEAILFAKDIDEVDELMEDYFLSEPEAIESKLGSEPALRMHVLASVATGHVGTEEDLLAFFNRTFFAFAGDVYTIHGKIREVLDFLEKEEFINRHDGFLKPTFFGKRTSDLYIDPLSAVKMRDTLREPRDDPIFHLWSICTTPDMPKLYLRRGDYAWVEQKIEEAEFTFPIEDYDFFLAEVKTAALLDDWTAERTEEEVTKKFGIGPGDVRRMTDQAEWLLYSMAELGRIFNKKKVRALTRLTTRVQYGVKEELLELISLRGVGRVRGRALHQRGFKSLRDLQKANPNDLARIPAIGPNLAKKIKEQVGVPIERGALEGQAGLGDFA